MNMDWVIAIIGVCGLVWVLTRAPHKDTPTLAEQATSVSSFRVLQTFDLLALEALFADAGYHYAKQNAEIDYVKFLARYVQDTLHPTARIVDASIPEAR